jgi:hypothetical protein
MAASDDRLSIIYGMGLPWRDSVVACVPGTRGGYWDPSLSVVIRGKEGFCGVLSAPGPADGTVPGITYRGKKEYPTIGRLPGCCYRWLGPLGRAGRCPAEEGNLTRRPGRARRSSVGHQRVVSGDGSGIKAETRREHPIDALPPPHHRPRTACAYLELRGY